MRKLIGLTGSDVMGADPFDPMSWSGSSRRFFLECQRQGILARAFGAEVSKPTKLCYALMNYSTNRERWRTKYYSDPGYRRCLTKELTCRLRESDYLCDFFQLGALFDIAGFVKGRANCYSYNDGNFAIRVQSPNFPRGISKSDVERTWKYEAELNAKLDLIFTMSEHLRRSFITDYGIPPHKVVCIGAGINLDALPEAEREKDYSRQNILFAGVEFARKGGYQVLHAFKAVRQKLPKATLHIVGPRQVLKDVAAEAGVVWHGYLNKLIESDMKQLTRLFEDASVFLMPSLYEPFGIAPLEAMSHRVPCITSNQWALPEIVPDRVCGRLVEVGNSEQLAHVLQELLENPALLKQYGEAGREHVKRNYTWTKVVSNLRTALSVRQVRNAAAPD
jgi:glycosyltransferase involved in cell wall biosynthesis